MMDGRRSLAFSRLEQVMPEVDHLLAGYRAVGSWSLGQVCNHLSGTMLCSVDGFQEAAPWLLRKIIGPIAKRQLLATGTMMTGINVPEKYLPKPGLDDRAEAEALRATIRVFSAASGPLAPHPFLGKLTPAEWQRFHCIHGAHHLGFLVPELVRVG